MAEEEFICGCIVDFSEDRSEGKCIKLCKGCDTGD